MKTTIALFRGINVGGTGKLPMKTLASILESLGATEVQTYIQSGNAVFRHPEGDSPQLTTRISRAILKKQGFEPKVLLLNASTFKRLISNNPFPEGEADPKTLHLGFLTQLPKSTDLKKLESLRKGAERFSLKGQAFYLHLPEGLGKSKLAAGAEKALGVPVTFRNWNTVSQLLKMTDP